MDKDHQEDKPTTETSQPRSPQKCVSLMQTIFVSLLVSALVVGAGLKVYEERYATKIIVIDMKAYTQELQKQMEKGQLDGVGLRIALESLDQRFQSLPENQVIILKEVVFGNVEEFKP